MECRKVNPAPSNWWIKIPPAARSLRRRAKSLIYFVHEKAGRVAEVAARAKEAVVVMVGW